MAWPQRTRGQLIRMPTPAYHRILLKLSGEALMGSQGLGIDPEVVERIAREVHGVRLAGDRKSVV
jgi:uridylate kinase